MIISDELNAFALAVFGDEWATRKTMAQERTMLIRLSIRGVGSLQGSYIQKRSVEEEIRLMKEVLSYVNYHADSDPDEPVRNTRIN